MSLQYVCSVVVLIQKASSAVSAASWDDHQQKKSSYGNVSSLVPGLHRFTWYERTCSTLSFTKLIKCRNIELSTPKCSCPTCSSWSTKRRTLWPPTCNKKHNPFDQGTQGLKLLICLKIFQQLQEKPPTALEASGIQRLLCTMAVCSSDISTQVLAISWTPGHNVQENGISVAVLQEQKHWPRPKRKPTSYDANFIEFSPSCYISTGYLYLKRYLETLDPASSQHRQPGTVCCWSKCFKRCAVGRLEGTNIMKDITGNNTTCTIPRYPKRKAHKTSKWILLFIYIYKCLF